MCRLALLIPFHLAIPPYPQYSIISPMRIFGFLGSFVGGKVVYQGRNRILASDANSMILFEHPEEIASHDVHSPSAPDIIRAVYPNPFRDGLKLELSPKESGPLKVDIYNIKGQKVRTLHDAFARNTDLSLFWDARDSSGQTVSSGLYFVRAKSRAGQEVRRAILIKP
jgi:hypothetical protein